MSIGIVTGRENLIGSTSGLVAPRDSSDSIILASTLGMVLATVTTSANNSIGNDVFIKRGLPDVFGSRFTGDLEAEKVAIEVRPATDKLESTISEVGNPRLRWLHYVSSRLRTMSERTSDAELPVIDVRVINRALDLAHRLFPPNVPPPSVGTTDDGGVDFVWHRGGWDVED